MPLNQLSKMKWRGRLATCGVLALAVGHAASAHPERLLANLVIGGAERRCSSYSGNQQSRDCTADWDTILAQDPAFTGMTGDDISFDAEYPVQAFTYNLTAASLEALRQVPARLFHADRKTLVMAQLTRALQDSGPQQHLVWGAVEQILQNQGSHCSRA